MDTLFLSNFLAEELFHVSLCPQKAEIWGKMGIGEGERDGSGVLFQWSAFCSVDCAGEENNAQSLHAAFAHDGYSLVTQCLKVNFGENLLNGLSFPTLSKTIMKTV